MPSTSGRQPPADPAHLQPAAGRCAGGPLPPRCCQALALARHARGLAAIQQAELGRIAEGLQHLFQVGSSPLQRFLAWGADLGCQLHQLLHNLQGLQPCHHKARHQAHAAREPLDPEAQHAVQVVQNSCRVCGAPHAAHQVHHIVAGRRAAAWQWGSPWQTAAAARQQSGLCTSTLQRQG